MCDREGQAIGGFAVKASGTCETGGCVGEEGHAADNSCALTGFRGSSQSRGLSGSAPGAFVDEHFGVGELEQRGTGPHVVPLNRNGAKAALDLPVRRHFDPVQRRP